MLERAPVIIGRAIVTIGAEMLYAQGLSRNGRLAFYEMVGHTRRGEPYALSEQTPVLDGFTRHHILLGQNLSELSQKPFLIVGNYPSIGPLRGQWAVIETSNFIKELTGKETQWVMGAGKNPLIRPLHERHAFATNSILVDETSGNAGGALDVLHALRKGNAVALYPEGKPGSRLRRADPKAGGIIFAAARHDTPVIEVVSYINEQGALITKILPPVDLEQIQEVGLRSQGKEHRRERYQAIGDMVMIPIAKQLPVAMQGAYREFILSEF